MRLMALHKRASSEGVRADSVEDAMDSENPKASLVQLLLAKQRDEGTARSQELLAELSQLRVMALHRRAVTAGVDEAVLEGVMEGASPKERLIELLLEQESR